MRSHDSAIPTTHSINSDATSKLVVGHLVKAILKPTRVTLVDVIPHRPVGVVASVVFEVFPLTVATVPEVSVWVGSSQGIRAAYKMEHVVATHVLDDIAEFLGGEFDAVFAGAVAAVGWWHFDVVLGEGVFWLWDSLSFYFDFFFSRGVGYLVGAGGVLVTFDWCMCMCVDWWLLLHRRTAIACGLSADDYTLDVFACASS
jgi:hypothetical protein